MAKERKAKFREQTQQSIEELRSIVRNSRSPTADGKLKTRHVTLPKRRDFSELAGTWVEDPAFDEAIAESRQVEAEDRE